MKNIRFALRTSVVFAFRAIHWTGRAASILLRTAQGLLSLLILGAIAWGIASSFKPSPPRFALDIDLTVEPPDVAPVSGFLQTLLPSGPTLAEIVGKIDAASHDARVSGIRVTIGPGCCNLVLANELHQALSIYRQLSHQPVEVFATGFGEGSGRLGGYLVGTAASNLNLLNTGTWGVTGLHLEVPFIHELLTRFGVTPVFTKEGAYKSYPETFTRDAPSPAHEEMLQSIADSLYDRALASISQARRVPLATLKTALTDAPLTADDARARGLIDNVSTSLPGLEGPTLKTGQLPTLSLQAGGPDVKLADYMPPPPGGTTPIPVIAIVHATGEIQPPSATASTRNVNPITLVATLRQAMVMPHLAAIVLRVDSGGGAVIGASLIDQEIQRIAKTVPVVVSMGGAAASGGYWISAHATRILAEPATLTGSIGVFAGNFVAREFLDTVGVHMHPIDRGAPGPLWSNTRDATDRQHDQLAHETADIYRTFLAVVADGRHMTIAQVAALAEGRVWTGAQALENHLVDRLGGYLEAIADARLLGHLAPDAPYSVVYPAAGSLTSQLASLADTFRGAGISIDPSLARLAEWLTPSVTIEAQMPPIFVE